MDHELNAAVALFSYGTPLDKCAGLTAQRVGRPALLRSDWIEHRRVGLPPGPIGEIISLKSLPSVGALPEDIRSGER